MLARRYLDVLIRTQAISRKRSQELDKIVQKSFNQHEKKQLREEFWYSTEFLPDTVVNRQGVKEDCFAFMFRHTQRRPRDILAQMQSIITQARNRGEFPYISAGAVEAGVHNETALQQILAGALTPYEGSLPIELVEAARSVFYQRSRIMEGKDVINFAKELYNLNPLATIDPEDFIHALLRCGAIGILENSDSDIVGRIGSTQPPYRKAKFEYLMQGNLPLADRFLYCVHPVMGDLFNMSKGDSKCVIYPLPDQNEGTWLEEAAGIL